MLGIHVFIYKKYEKKYEAFFLILLCTSGQENLNPKDAQNCVYYSTDNLLQNMRKKTQKSDVLMWQNTFIEEDNVIENTFVK